MDTDNRLDNVDDAADAKEQRLSNAIDTIRDCLNHDTQPSEWEMAAELAGFILDHMAKQDEPEAFFADICPGPVAVGHFLLQQLGGDLSFDKRKWLDVAEVLGPDHAQTMYRAAVFMTKVA